MENNADVEGARLTGFFIGEKNGYFFREMIINGEGRTN